MEARLPGLVRLRFVNHKRLLLVIALAAAYCWRVYTSAQDLGQLFNFTVIGIATGCVIAIAASGLVLTYATTGVFNFAHGAVGMIAAYAFYALSVQHDVPVPLALVIVLGVLGPLVGLLLERVMRHFHDAPVQTSVTVTIALMVMLIGVAQKLFPPTTGARLDFLFGLHTWRLWEAMPTYDDVAHFVTAVAVALLLRALLYRSRTGTAMRAVVDNPGLAALNGAPPVAIARYSWMLGSTLGALAGIFLAAGGPLDPIVLTFFVTGALGAAIVGKLESLPLTFAGAIALGVVMNHALFALPSGSGWDSVRISIPGIFLFLALLLVPSARLTVGRVVGRRSPAVPSLPSSVIRAAVFVVAMVVLVGGAPADRVPDMTTALIYAVLLLSLVVLTGFSGQISLCQYVFLAMGTWAMGTFFGGNSIWGMLLAGLVALPLGVLIALPAMRLSGLYLALVTFGFAAVAEDLLLKNSHFYGTQSVPVGRLHFLDVSFDSDKAFFVLCAITFAVMALGVLALRRGPFGRRLAAMRDSQAACATLGLDVRRTKLAVFAISAFMAGIAGALFGGLKTTADAIQFSKENNIVLLLFAVVGGITTVTGALIGGTLFALLPFVQSQYPDQAGLVFAGVAVAVVALGRQPNGLAGILYDRSGRRREAAHRNRRRVPVAVAGAALVVAAAGNATANAQTIDSSNNSDSPASQFGAYKLDAHGEGISLTYDSPGLIPGTPSPLFAASLPEASANMDSGPSAYALSSLVYPGPLVADLPSVLAVGGVPNANAIPAYPVRAQAFYPAGPTDADEQVGTGRQKVTTSDSAASATTDYGAAQLPGIVNVGAVTSKVDDRLENGSAISRTRVELSSVDLIGGLVHFESITTDLVATSNATDAASDGTTTVTGMTLLGAPATIEDANQVLAPAGIEVKLLEPSEVKSGSEASRLASGLLVTVTYNGSTEPVLSQLLDQIPVESLPSQGIGPIPFSSPQSLVLALKATHVETIGLAAGSVHASAKPPFELPAFASKLGSTGSAPLARSGTKPGGFTTPAPQPVKGAGGEVGDTVGAPLPIAFATAGPLAGALVILLAALATALAVKGGGRFADKVLTAGRSSCPEGR